MKGKAKPKQPRFRSSRKLVKFFDSHDLGNCRESLPEVDFEIDIRTQRNFFRIEAGVARKLNEIAPEEISPQLLIDAWLREKVSKGAA